MKSLFHYLQKSVLQHGGDQQTDGELLESFLTRQEESAFALLVQRHGPMVLAVARRLLGNTEDAEDVFQATFLVLVRKASRIARRDLLGNWLYGVAYRTALEARRLRSRRQARERQVDVLPDPVDRARTQCPELPGLLDAALSRLPDKYRTAIVLCDLQGCSRQEAARHLCIPEGTLSSRLATGRRQLARRLARQGFPLSTGALAASLAESGSACPPAPLMLATGQAALRLLCRSTDVPIASAKILSLVDGVIRAMFLHKIKVSTAVIVVLGLIGLVLGALVQDLWFSATSFASDPPRQGQPAKVAVAQAPVKENQSSPKVEPKLSDVIRPGDRLQIRVPGTLPDAPIQGVFQVEASGKVALGAPYGRVLVKGLSLEEAEQVITNRLAEIIKDPRVSLTRYDATLDGAAAGQVAELKARILKLEERVERLEAEMRAPQPNNFKPKPKKEVGVKAADVVETYQGLNAALTVEKYQDKRIAVTGHVLRIKGGDQTWWFKGILGYDFVLEMSVAETIARPYLGFRFFLATDSPVLKQLAQLKPGQLVTVEGECQGWLQKQNETDGRECIFFHDSKVVQVGK